MVKREVEIKPIYQSCWISYLGAASGILKSLGRNHDIVDIGGYSGWSFFINVSKGVTCPSSPTAHRAYPDIIKGTESFGFSLDGYNDQGGFPSQEGELSETDKERAHKMFEAFKELLDKTNKPIILWGIPVPEYGIAYGYEDDSYLVSTFRGLNNQPDDPIKFDQLQSPGTMHFFSFNEEIGEITEQSDKDAIARALKLTQGGSALTHENYVAGPEAFTIWADVLDEGSNDPHFYHGTSYVAECALEGRITAVEFLIRFVQKYEEKKQANCLNHAAVEFTQSLKLMKEFNELFPFSFQGDMTKEKRTKGAKLLRKVKPHELNAIAHLREALHNWI
ncbi:MAG: hypothetical protein ACTSQF_11295 [Candidatus Heimdallarchaeaceae archaeon]